MKRNGAFLFRVAPFCALLLRLLCAVLFKLYIRLRNKNIRRGGIALMLKKRSSRKLVIPFGIKVDGHLQLKFSRFHKSTANKFELHRGLREEMIPQLLPSFFSSIVHHSKTGICRIINSFKNSFKNEIIRGYMLRIS